MSKTRRKKIKEIQKIAKQYIDYLDDNDFFVQKAYLFGSYARGDFHKESDIDIAIISKKLVRNWDKNENYLWHIRRKINPLIEPIGFAPENFTIHDPLVYEIKQTGIRIK